MLSQKLHGMAKKFILQGLMFLQGRRHTYSMSRSWKNSVTPQGGLFTPPSTVIRPTTKLTVL